MMNYILLISLVICLVTTPAISNTTTNQESRSIANFANLATGCLADGKLSGNESLGEIEKKLADQFGIDYQGTCSYLLQGFGYLNEFHDPQKVSDIRLIAFSDERPGPTIEKDEDGNIVGNDNRYVIYFDRAKTQFAGVFFPHAQFVRALAERGLKVEDASEFRFPILVEQKRAADLQEKKAKHENRAAKEFRSSDHAPPSRGSGSSSKIPATGIQIWLWIAFFLFVMFIAAKFRKVVIDKKK